jgi:hypothetical protein
VFLFKVSLLTSACLGFHIKTLAWVNRLIVPTGVYIFRSENYIYSPPPLLKMFFFFPLSQHIVLRLPSWPFCLNSSLFCNHFTLLFPLYSFPFPFLPFSFPFLPFSFTFSSFFLFAFSYFSPQMTSADISICLLQTEYRNGKLLFVCFKRKRKMEVCFLSIMYD